LSIVLLPLLSIINVYGFLREKQYVLAIFLVGQPILKIMIKPLVPIIGEDLALMYYFMLGFFVLIVRHVPQLGEIRISKHKFKYTAFYFSVLMVLLIFVAKTPNTIGGLDKLIGFVVMTLPCIFLANISLDSEQDFIKFMRALANISLLVGVITIVLVYTKTGRLTAHLGTTVAQELQIFGVNFVVSIWFGRRMGIAFFASFYVFVVTRNRKDLFKAVLLFLFVLLSGARGPIFSLLTTIVLMVTIAGEKWFTSSHVKNLLLLLVTGVALAVFATFFYDNLLLARVLNFRDGNVIARTFLVRESIALIRQNPFGYGLGSFAVLTSSIHSYPHNVVLEILVELGFGGVVVFLIGTTIAILDFTTVARINGAQTRIVYLCRFAFSIFTFALLNAQFSGNLVTNEYIWLGFALVQKSCIVVRRCCLEVETSAILLDHPRQNS